MQSVVHIEEDGQQKAFVSVAASLVTIGLLERVYMANALRMGAYIIRHTADWQKRHRILGDVRGRGLMIGVELVHDQDSKEKAPDLRNRVIQMAFQKGLLLLGAGENTIRIAPPLMIDNEQAEFAVATLDACLTAVEGKR
jgi:4-aminobutyrate aminotransferase